MSAIDQLCPNCGLCCDSTLFADVELRAGDDRQFLQKAGIKFCKKGKTKVAFAQPCACFDGKFCKIYEDRPKRCRLFECGLLKKVESGKMTPAAALKKIHNAKLRAGDVRTLLRALGQTDEQMPLTQRYTEVMVAPIDFSAESSAEQRGELMLAVNDLMNQLQRDFLR